MSNRFVQESQREKKRAYIEMLRFIDAHLGGWRVGDTVRFDGNLLQVIGFNYELIHRYDEGWLVVLGRPNIRNELIVAPYIHVTLYRRGS